MELETWEMDSPPRYGVIQFFFGGGDTESRLTIMYRGRQLYIHLFEENFAASPQLREKYLFYLQVAEDDELDGVTVEDVYDWIMEPFFPMLRDFPLPDHHKTPTLQDYFNPETLNYTLHGTASGERVPSPYEPDPDDQCRVTETGIRLPDELYAPWPRFYPAQIQICVGEDVEAALSRVPKKVKIVDGSEVLFLKHYSWGDQQRAKQELRNHKRIEDAGLGKEDDLRISRLRGTLHDNEGYLVGLLLSYIDCRNRNLLCAAGKPGVPDALRRKWADQVTSTVGRLHAAGAFWGDAKADNVLVDAQNDTWVIDFGGGYTEGWVDKDKADSVEGDLQGLAKILEYVGGKENSK
ncbi:hypothetical protein F4778DRAFT_752271 [Xylariomycetidae sp. FL2044]|nr:hypothetical protein F4778DRAFT_752271 [Xylariomycetidae sp. FL2044]